MENKRIPIMHEEGERNVYGPTIENTRIDSSLEAEILFQQVDKGRYSYVTSRITGQNSGYKIKSGDIFVYLKDATGIKRWSDNKAWGPSRSCEAFFIYRELEEKTGHKVAGGRMKFDRTLGNYKLKVGGFIKKTYSAIAASGGTVNMVAYYTEATLDSLCSIQSSLDNIQNSKGPDVQSLSPKPTAQAFVDFDPFLINSVFSSVPIPDHFGDLKTEVQSVGDRHDHDYLKKKDPFLFETDLLLSPYSHFDILSSEQSESGPTDDFEKNWMLGMKKLENYQENLFGFGFVAEDGSVGQ